MADHEPATAQQAEGERCRVRIRFCKTGKIRWTSHRDLARMWERAFRRERLPLAYSGGCSPRPKVSFGLALPTGHESVAEYMDVELLGVTEADVATLPGRLTASLPDGVEATAAEAIEAGTPSLQEEVTSCTWRWAVAPADGSAAPTGEEMDRLVAGVLSSEELPVTRLRKGTEQTEDIRPAIVDLTVTGPADPEIPGGFWLQAELACRPRSIRPSDVTLALGPGLEERDVRRLNQWIWRDGARREPLVETAPSSANGARHAEERVL